MVTRESLRAWSRVLVEWPDASDGEFRIGCAKRVRDELDMGFHAEKCAGRWCLFAKDALPSGSEEALR